MGNGENVKRESYVCTPEYEAALETLPAGEQEKAEEMKERLEDFASAQEKQKFPKSKSFIAFSAKDILLWKR